MELISKADIVAEIERRIKCDEMVMNHNTQITELLSRELNTLYELSSFIKSLEVKEVDFERDLSKYVSNGIHRFFPNVNDDYCKMDSVIWQDYVIETAKHFFELGIKAKGE